MKKLTSALVVGLLLAGCQQDKSSQPAKSDDKAATTAAAAPLADKDKLAYAVGASMATNVERLNSQFKSLDLDPAVVQRGFADQLAKQSQMDEAELMAQSRILSEKIRFEQQQMAQQKQTEITEKKAKNAEYLKENLTKGFTATESGLQFKVIQAAPESAAKPEATSKVKVHYTGTLTDGTKFDSSVDRNQPFEFSLRGGVIQGWLEGVKMMPVGSKYQFVIPPELAYGFQDHGPIPAASILIFDIELLEIMKDEPAAEAATKTDGE